MIEEIKTLLSSNVLSNFIQAILALAALWYTIETRRYRIQNQRNLELLDKELLAEHTPFLILDGVNILTKKANVKNSSKSLAREVQILFYDHNSDVFYYSRYGIIILDGKETREMEFDMSDKNQLSILKYIRKTYLDRFALSTNVISRDKNPYILVLYKDILGNLMGTKTQFLFKGHRWMPCSPLFIKFYSRKHTRRSGIWNRLNQYFLAIYEEYQANKSQRK